MPPDVVEEVRRHLTFGGELAVGSSLEVGVPVFPVCVRGRRGTGRIVFGNRWDILTERKLT